MGFWDYVDLRDYMPLSALPKDGSSLYLTRLDEEALTRMTTITGLSYVRLETPENLARALLTRNLAAERTAEVDIRWMLGSLTLLLLLITRLNFSPTGNTFANPLAKLVLGVPTGSAKHQLGP